MPFVQIVNPQYRDADKDGLIGLRGIMHNFQDIHTWHLLQVNKGNDVIPEKYGAGWIYTRYHVVLKKKMDYSGPLKLTAWMEPYRQPVLVNENITIEQNGILYSSRQARNLRLQPDPRASDAAQCH